MPKRQRHARSTCYFKSSLSFCGLRQTFKSGRRSGGSTGTMRIRNPTPFRHDAKSIAGLAMRPAECRRTPHL
ncbi:MAG: hypothetical protein C6Y20_05730 [Tagaea sp. CACIAM 22H2]|nr:hypothetical protein [Tagaea sp. CACIAM 22H2]